MSRWSGARSGGRTYVGRALTLRAAGGAAGGRRLEAAAKAVRGSRGAVTRLRRLERGQPSHWDFRGGDQGQATAARSTGLCGGGGVYRTEPPERRNQAAERAASSGRGNDGQSRVPRPAGGRGGACAGCDDEPQCGTNGVEGSRRTAVLYHGDSLCCLLRVTGGLSRRIVCPQATRLPARPRLAPGDYDLAFGGLVLLSFAHKTTSPSAQLRRWMRARSRGRLAAARGVPALARGTKPCRRSTAVPCRKNDLSLQ